MTLHVDFRFAQNKFLTHVCNWDEYFHPAQIFFRNQRVWGYYQLVLKKGKYITFVLYSGHKLPEWSTQWYLWQISSAPTQNFLRNPTEISWINFTVCGLWQTAPINSLAPSTMNGKDRPKYDAIFCLFSIFKCFKTYIYAFRAVSYYNFPHVEEPRLMTSRTAIFFLQKSFNLCQGLKCSWSQNHLIFCHHHNTIYNTEINACS